MVSRTERYLAKAAQCESAATSAADRAMMALYLELARQWRQIGEPNKRSRLKYPDMQLAPSTTMLVPLKVEAPACHFAGVISRQTSSANVRSHGIDRACRRDAYVSHKRCTAITAASHASMFAIDIRAGDSIEIGVTFQ